MDAVTTAFPKPVARAKERKPLRRTSRLQAKRWGIAWRRPKRLDGPGSDPARLSWIHEQRCLLLAFDPDHRCGGRIEACHEGQKPGVALKCSDALTLAMCTAAHAAWTNHRGFFLGWPKAKRREWADERIAETTALLFSHGGRRSP